MIYSIFKKYRHNQSGLTTIELLSSIAVMVSLSLLVFAFVSMGKTMLRNDIRLGDAFVIKQVLGDFYRKYGHYPICGESDWDASFADYGVKTESGSDCFNLKLKTDLKEFSGTLIDSLGTDPLNPGNKPLSAGGSDTYIFRYISAGNGDQYALVFGLEGRKQAVVIRGD